MPLTPADVHNVAFKKPPIGKRGYDEEEVDAFLDEVERELSRLLEENGHLRSQLGLAGDADPDRRLRADVASLRAQVDRVRQEALAAEQAAASMQAELEQSRGRAASAADSQDHRVLMMAQRTADDHISDARREADKLLATARSSAQDLLRETRSKADALESEARKRHEEAVNSLDKKRKDALETISTLANMARDYHTRLTEALTSQMQELEHPPTRGRSGGGAPRASAGATGARNTLGT